MDRKVRPYLFYDTTQALCSHCLRTIQAHVIFRDEKVFLDKWCPVHGDERVMISDDVDYYKLCREVYVKQPEMPFYFNTKMQFGCPYDCGLCPDHMQHSCLSIIDINEACNLECPVCYADSGPKKQIHYDLARICRMLDVVVKNEKEPDVLQISGGEPTIHPQFFDILDEVKKRPFRHVMINTNGLRIASDDVFVERLANYQKGLEIYLQFDSLQDERLQVLRGASLWRIREAAIAKLNQYGISTTLVMTVKKGLNDDEIGEVIRYGLSQPCVRGVTLQPIQNAGRVENYQLTDHKLTISEIRRKIAEQSGVFQLADVIPVPCNPDNLAMAYALKLAGDVTPLTGLIDPAVLIDASKNTIVFETQPDLKAQLFKTFSTNLDATEQANCLSELMCCLPAVQHTNLSYENVFRVLIVNFMDAATMDIRALKKSCIHFATEDKMIPFEAYNLFYRTPAQRETLATIQQEVMRFYEQRSVKPN
ncbi:radical SAM protein [Leeia sp. TBRC 13508]|uniref:Radical SAM protein n=1 Tax=Leeia speluncae TaxID=2884804 RepID=A0ABS8D3H3_9NEIS|nr:radical SAM protein [Leeia speluncae]MCB6182725.1 radical SAM protein [Leeia speluncae]